MSTVTDTMETGRTMRVATSQETCLFRIDNASAKRGLLVKFDTLLIVLFICVMRHRLDLLCAYFTFPIAEFACMVKSSQRAFN
ncbi:hypothetical protein J2X69_000984 [Algoriphagus sp. 4150]|nr:hypothetical protein [Algoriphagus sp. 4150]